MQKWPYDHDLRFVVSLFRQSYRPMFNSQYYDKNPDVGALVSYGQIYFLVNSDCGSITDLENVNIEYSSGTFVYSTATFTCDTGYQLQGDNSTTCLSSGSWSEYDANCTIIGNKYTFFRWRLVWLTDCLCNCREHPEKKYEGHTFNNFRNWFQVARISVFIFLGDWDL